MKCKSVNKRIKVAIVGIGNCSSSLIQGIHYYHDTSPSDAVGLMYWEIGGYRPFDIDIVAAFDIDERKVGLDVNEAIFSKPNCTTIFYDDLPKSSTIVKMGKVLDGLADHMSDHSKDNSFVLSSQKEQTKEQIISQLRTSNADVLINFLPVGSEQATRFYAECALDSGVAFVNCIPVFIASDPSWAKRFKEKNLPIIGDDIKAQLGATITHRTLTDLFHKRGVKIERTYQLNTGGNTDFLNMQNIDRLASKKESKTEAVQSVAAERILDENIHVGPSDYIAWQKDNKVCFIRMEGRLFGNIPMNIELRLSVEDSPNSAGISIDAIRCAKIALERNLGGAVYAASAYYCKHPPQQFPDDKAYEMVSDFIMGINNPIN